MTTGNRRRGSCVSLEYEKEALAIVIIEHFVSCPYVKVPSGVFPLRG